MKSKTKKAESNSKQYSSDLKMVKTNVGASVQIQAKCKQNLSRFKQKISEALFIKELHPSLNTQETFLYFCIMTNL